MEIDPGGAPKYIRRLPIYLLIGTSASMAGAPIQAVSQGINLLYNELMNDASAIETVYVAVITFDSQARMVTPLTELTQFTPPALSAGGKEHSLGAALRLLREALDRDIIPNTPERKGDYKPLVFLMTDSMPTDAWEGEADAIKNRTKQKVATIIALGCGGGVDQSTLRRITEVVLLMNTVTPDQINQFFKWVSQSVPAKSEQGAETPPSLVPLSPGGIRIALGAEEPSPEQVETPEEEPETSVPDQVAIPAEAVEGPGGMVCVMDDGTEVRCETEPFAQGADSYLHWTLDGRYVIKLYHAGLDSLESAPDYVQDRILALEQIVPKYGEICDDPYWQELILWPDGVVKKPGPGVRIRRAPEGMMELRWFLGAKPRRVVAAKHGPDKVGKWTNHLSLAIKMARIVRRLHSFGIVHSDLSFRNFLADPEQNKVVLIGFDQVVVPGVVSPSVLGTPMCMAPELAARVGSSESKVDPSQETDLHSLATLIYWLLFQRHPLIGPKEQSPDPALDEILRLGERALFIEHPTDTSNHIPNLPLPYTTLLTPAVQRLVERAFVEGLHAPEKRPTAAEWERDLVRMADSVVPCANRECPLQSFVLLQATPVRCPACATLLDNPPVLSILHFYRPVTGSRGQFENDDGYILVGWPGRAMHVWHTDVGQAPGPGVDTASMTRLEFDATEKRWSLVNEAIDELRILKENGNHQQVSIGSSCELADGMRLLLGQADKARLVLVQLQRLPPAT